MTGSRPSTAAQIERLSQILVETSFHASSEPIYRLTSGVLSRYYVDCKIALSYPEFRQIAGELILEKNGALSIEAVGGMALGAYPIALAVSDAFYRLTGRTVRAFVVRKEPKSHGMKKYVEGDVRKGDRVLIVDDVITTGGSTIDAIARSREEGLEVVKAVALIDRQELDGAKNIEACGVPFDALVTLKYLSDAQAFRVPQPKQ